MPVVGNTLKLGDYVTYEGEPYVVLYDMDSSYNWIEIVSENPLESVTLGTDDPTSAASGTSDPYIRAKWSYNNAISTLNTIAQNYLNTDLADRARCIGSNPENPLSEGAIRSYDKVKAIDTNYQTDYTQLNSINASSFSDNNYEYYWLASRGWVLDTNGRASLNSFYGIRRADISGNVKDLGLNDCTLGSLLVTYEMDYESLDEYQREENSDLFKYKSATAGFRPVIKLKNSVKVVRGNGTKTSPYILQK